MTKCEVSASQQVVKHQLCLFIFHKFYLVFCETDTDKLLRPTFSLYDDKWLNDVIEFGTFKQALKYMLASHHLSCDH